MGTLNECADSLRKVGEAIKDFNNSFQGFAAASWRFGVLCMIDEHRVFLEKIEKTRGVRRMWFRLRALIIYRRIVKRLRKFYF